MTEINNSAEIAAIICPHLEKNPNDIFFIATDREVIKRGYKMAKMFFERSPYIGPKSAYISNKISVYPQIFSAFSPAIELQLNIRDDDGILLRFFWLGTGRRQDAPQMKESDSRVNALLPVPEYAYVRIDIVRVFENVKQYWEPHPKVPRDLQWW